MLTMTDAMLRTKIAFEIVERTILSFFAPKYWATIIPIPTARPELKEKQKKFMEPHVPTAARALDPTKFPTTIESTML